MKTRRNMVKRWIAGVLAVTMLSSTMSTAAFAAPESTDAPETVETTRVTAWNWTDGSALTWQEDTSAWTLTLSEEQTISAEADLLALLPVSVEATLAQAETESTPAPDTAATPAPESTPDTEATEVTPTPVAEVDPAAEEGATAPAAAALAQPEEGATGADTLSVEPQNNEEATPAPETATPAPTAAPQPAESPAPTEDAEPTEEPAATETLTLTWDTAALTYPLAGGDYTVTAALPEGYALDEAAPALAVVVKVPGAGIEDTPAADNSLSDGASAPSMMAGNYVAGDPVQTVSPVGTTINLFDYWFSSPTEKTNEFINFNPPGSNPHITEYKQTSWCKGINAGHVLKFSPSTGSEAYGDGSYWKDGWLWTPYKARENPTDKANRYTNSEAPYEGIVADKLVGGYPVLSNTPLVQGSVTEGNEVLHYDESLAYLFDPGADTNYRAVYTDVGGLLKVDESTGCYVYDSSQNYARFQADNSGSGNFTVYENPGEGFFPFNDINDVEKDSDGNIWNVNHFFGLTMTTQFIQPADGVTSDGDPVTYEFAGDDDVWVFIDGVLVGDLGGIHKKASLSINFQTGQVQVNGADKGTLKSIFYNAGEDVSTGFEGDTFADGSYHTLQFFYLERGANSSNLTLKFNLVSAPESTIRSVNQNGQGVNGTQFTLSAADIDYGNLTQIASGKTESEGSLVLQDTDGNNIGLNDLWNTLEQAGRVYTDNAGRQRANLVLQQAVPDGYRGEDTIQLYLLESGQNVLLLSDNTWDTGAYAYSNSTISMSGSFEYGTGGSANLKTDGGTMFAVILRREKKDTPETDSWYMLTGSATAGWNKADQPVNNNVAAVLAEYQDHPENFYQMELSASGGYEVTVRDLPGDITKYYYILDDQSKNQAEYNIAFYYTTAGSIAGANANNTWMVNKTGSWTRIFSTDVYVATIKNRLLIQQLDPDGNPITGATFALYGSDYYAAEGQVNQNAKPVGTMTTANLTKNSQGIDLEGGALFPTGNDVLKKGTYYLVQTGAPEGYEVNAKVTKVIVDDTGVYADAGDADDGIQVARGVGSVVKSLAEFASSPDIDATLNNIVGKFYTTATVPDSGNFEGFTWRTLGSGNESTPAAGVTYHPSYWYTNGEYSLAGVGDKPADAEALGMHMEYGTSAAILEYGPGKEILDKLGGQALYWMVTDTGWSNLMMEQCQQHTQAIGKNYESLVGKDLSNLFSRSVVVRVTDQVQTCKLTVSNVVSDPIGNDNNQPFTVRIGLTKGSTTDLAETYSYTGSILKDSGAQVPADGELKVPTDTVILTSGQVITIQDIPYGTQFTVTATSENYTASYTVTAGDTSPLSDGTENGASGTLLQDSTVAITNTRITVGSVAVSNTVEGAMGSYSDTFSYTLKLYDKTADNVNPAISGTYQATLQPKDGTSSSVTIIFGADGTASQITPDSGATTPIQLKDGDTLTISGLPAGASFEAVETDDHKGYIVAVDPQKTGEGDTKVDRTGLVTVPNSADAPASIAFTNTREAIVPTGMREENNPYIVMIGLAGMAALVGAAGWVEMRRRKRREEE